VWGATATRTKNPSREQISIHAPRVGRDTSIICMLVIIQYFNPRAPCGARPDSMRKITTIFEFQSTRPVWGATAIMARISFTKAISIHAPRVGRDHYAAPLGSWLVISIHAPRVGRDARGAVLAGWAAAFQSTRPVWGATFPRAPCKGAGGISIHAPRVGRDARLSVHIHARPHFNPRAPCGARHEPAWADMQFRLISIHAPRVGRDRQGAGNLGADFHFNPRAPCGARRSVSCVGVSPLYFNPRAPCGARPEIPNLAVVAWQFQSTRPVWGAT